MAQMKPATSAVVVLCLAGVAAAGPQRLDPKLFAPRQGWTYAIPVNPPAAVDTPSREQMIEDIAYLQRALDEAWAWSSRSTKDAVASNRGYLRDVPLKATDAKTMCELIAEVLRTGGVTLDLGGTRCKRWAPPPPVSVKQLDTVPAGRNYQLRIDKAKDHEVGVLTISHFVDPSDAGWKGFADDLRRLQSLELILVDAQNADGDDPRAGFAVLAALGAEDYDSAYFRSASVKDTDIAKAARANFQKLVPNAPPVRSRTLWSSFPTPADVERIAREVVPGLDRPGRPVKWDLLTGPDCGRACQLMVQLVRLRSDLYGSFDDRSSGDEYGAIRLPHTGIVVTFPTVAYGPYVMSLSEGRQLPAELAKGLLDGLHAIGHDRAESFAWRSKPLPDCAKLTPNRKLLESKATGCRKPVAAGTVENVRFWMSVEATTAKKFFDGCPALEAHGSMESMINGTSEFTVYATGDAIEQAASAPFVTHVLWECERHDEPNASQ